MTASKFAMPVYKWRSSALPVLTWTFCPALKRQAAGGGPNVRSAESAPPLSPKGLAGSPKFLEDHHFRLGLTNFQAVIE